MKIIFKIARTELRNLFYSPVAWFLAIVFLVQCAISYTDELLPVAILQDIHVHNNPTWKDFGHSLTYNIFYDYEGIFFWVLRNLYLFVPVLTMGVINREINGGTIRLLYSSPIRSRHIVLGKYLGIMVYNLVLVSIVGMFIVSGALQIKAVDYGLLLAAALAIYLLICAYTAIGIFMSSLSHYQIISAIGTFLILAVLERMAGFWQQYDFIRDLTYFLSISGRTGKMMNGLITTKDVLYFVVIVYIFLGFTLIRLRSGRESRPWYINAARYMMVLGSALAIGYISSRPSLTGYWDTTATRSNTLPPSVQKIIKEFGKEPLEITLYTNLLSDHVENGVPENRNNYLSDVWEPYQRFKPDLSFKYVYYYAVKKGDSTYYKSYPNKDLADIAATVADEKNTELSLFKTPEEFGKKVIDLEPEDLRTVMQVKYRGRATFLRTYPSGNFFPGDLQISAALKRLLQDTVPKIYFVTGNLERDVFKNGEREFATSTTDKTERSSLVNIGFDVDTVSPDSHVIPGDADIVVLADPKTRLSDVAMDRLRQYIARGGDMLILGEPGKQQVLNPVLQSLGVQMLPGTIVEPTKEEMPDKVKPLTTEYYGDITDDRSSFNILMPGVAALSATGSGPFTVKPILMTVARQTWLKQGVFATDSAEIVYDPQAGDVKGAYATALALTRETGARQQRILVCGDADFMSNWRGGGSFAGIDFYSWLDHHKFPVQFSKIPSADTLLLITGGAAGVLTIVYVWVLPALLFILGMILLIRRKKK